MTAYDNIVRALLHTGAKVVHVGSDRARAQCPVHQSRGLTLSLRRGDERALLHCFAGCDDVEVLAALDLDVKDLFDGPRDRPPAYVPPKRAPSPWDQAMADIGLRSWPPLDHVLDRMVAEEKKNQTTEGGAA